MDSLLSLGWVRSLAVFTVLTLYFYRWDLPSSIGRGIAALRRDTRTVKGSDWTKVFERLGIVQIQIKKRIPEDTVMRGSYRMLYVCLIPAVSGVFLMLVVPLPLPFFSLPFAFAQFRFDVFPILQSAVSGFLLFASLLLFAGPPRKGWRLHQQMRGAWRR